MPCGFSDKGLPVGMQIVGKEKNELGVLQFAKLFENNTNFYKQKPNIIL
jgi:Asp-tRNA(Asn)/Glu-tRNA(Gln) amidotransferase A subunit family amidase